MADLSSTDHAETTAAPVTTPDQCDPTRHRLSRERLGLNGSNDGLRRSEPAARRVTLRLLREIVEKSPEALHDILAEVGRLSSSQLDGFDRCSTSLIRGRSMPN
jgi:hypothetical protein